MILALLPESRHAPRIGIHHALDDHDSALLEQRPEFRRQQRDRAVHDEPVRLETPGSGWSRHADRDQGERDDESTHP